MRGQHKIIIESPRLKYEITVRRNITVIEGNSATGKTTLIDLIHEYQRRGKNSPIRIESDVQCAVYNGTEDNWQPVLDSMNNKIIFIDEGYHFIYTKEFAAAIEGRDNYFVFITRKPLTCLPYSIHEIYGIRTSGKYHFPEKIYNELYPLYDDEIFNAEKNPVTIITEDSKSGYQFIKSCCDEKIVCVSAGGNSNIYNTLRSIDTDSHVAIIADGAAFGAYIAKVLAYTKIRRKLLMYLPESFEWIVLKSGVVSENNTEEILANPEKYIDSVKFFSWERFFTDYLETITVEDEICRYAKQNLKPFYYEGKNKKSIINVYPEVIRKLLK